MPHPGSPATASGAETAYSEPLGHFPPLLLAQRKANARYWRTPEDAGQLGTYSLWFCWPGHLHWQQEQQARGRGVAMLNTGASQSGAAFHKYLQILHANMPPIEAVAVGVSLAARRADEYSDVDFFVLLPEPGFLSSVGELGRRISCTADCLAYRFEGYVQDFGFTFTLIDRDGTFIDLFINCPPTLPRGPMALKTRILLDATGQYTQLLRCQAPPEYSLQRNNAVVDVLVELDMLRKYAARRELVPLLHHLDQLRVVVIALERATKHGQPYNPYGSDSRLSAETGPGYEGELLDTFPTKLEPASIAEAITALLDRAARVSAEGEVDLLLGESGKLMKTILRDCVELLGTWQPRA